MAAQIGEIEELQDHVQSVDLIDVIDDPSESKQAQAQPELTDGQQCKQCYDNCIDGRVDPTDGAHATSIILKTQYFALPTIIAQRLPGAVSHNPPTRRLTYDLLGLWYCTQCWGKYGMNDEGDGKKEASYMGHNLNSLYAGDDY